MQGKLDGGLSWPVVFATFLQQFVVMGSHNVFGLFYIELLDEFQKGRAATGLVGSLAFGLSFLLGPITTALCHRFGNRASLWIGIASFSGGFLLTSFVKDFSQMFLTYSILVGFGGSLSYYTSLLILNEYFEKRLVTSNGLTLAGAGLGTLALSAGVEHFMELYGWKIAMRILCGFTLTQFISLGIHYAVQPPVKPNDYGLEVKKSKKKIYGTVLLKNKAYVIWVVAISLVLFGFYIPYVHLVRHCQDLNIPKSKGAILVGYLAISQTIGKIVFGRIADHPRVNRIYLYQFCLLACSVSTTLLPIMTSIETITIYCWAFGFHDGCFVLLIAVITGDVVGKENMASAFGMMYFFSCIPMMIGPPVAGLMYGISGSYHPTFFMSGAFTTLSACLSFLIPVSLPQEIVDQWSMRNKAGKIQTPPSTDSITSRCTKTSSLDKSEREIFSTEKRGTNDVVVSMAKSGATETLRSLNGREETETRLSLHFQRYFSMEHIVSQRDSLISSFYSRESLYTATKMPKARETDV